ncbi:MAG: hypothetical protein FJ039_01385 [Chloroflexi bacterium]|nr:hypothetical protein [Chloroflexota bacterium]
MITSTIVLSAPSAQAQQPPPQVPNPQIPTPPIPAPPTPSVPTPPPHGGPPDINIEIPKGTGIDIPAFAKEALSDQEFIDVFCATARWQTQIFFDVMDVMSAAMPKVHAAAKRSGVDLTIPDIGKAKSEGEAKLSALCAVKTVAQAQDSLTDLLTFANDQRTLFMGMGQLIEQQMTAAGTRLQASIEGQLTQFVNAEASRLQAEIEGAVSGFVASALAAAGPRPNPAAITAAVTAQVNALVAQKETELTQRIQARVDSIVAAETGSLREIEEVLTEMGKQIDPLILNGSAKAQAYKKQALDKRKALVSKMIDANIAKARAQMEPYRKDLDAAKAKDPTVKSIDDITAQLNSERRTLERTIDELFAPNIISAEAEARFRAAVEEFAQRWENLSKEAGKTKISWATLIQIVRPQLAAAKAQLQQALQEINQVQAQATGKTDSQSLAVNALASDLNALKGRINALVTRVDSAISTLDGPAPAELPQSFLDQLTALQKDGEALLADVKGVDYKATKRLSLLIQAEDQFAASVARPGTSWDSTEEVRPSWRKDWIGTGDWYLSRGGDKLSYRFDVPNDGVFYIWVRDMRDDKHPYGARSINIAIDGKLLGEFNEVQQANDRFLWHRLTAQGDATRPFTVAISAGSHVMEVSKARTTSAAAVLDAYYFTTDAQETPPTVLPTQPKPPKVESILRQAEDETSASVAKPGTSWDSREEIRPSWRPGYTGEGVWYISRRGDKLTYQFTVQSDAEFYLWVRDLDDGKHAPGARNVILDIDNGAYRFNAGDAVTKDNQFHWRRVGQSIRIRLKPGTHTLVIEKPATTSAAFVIDAFLLTTDPQAVP